MAACDNRRLSRHIRRIRKYSCAYSLGENTTEALLAKLHVLPTRRMNIKANVCLPSACLGISPETVTIYEQIDRASSVFKWLILSHLWGNE